MINSPGFLAAQAIEFGAGMTVRPLLWRTRATYDGRNRLRVCILAIDRLLRRHYGVSEFSSAEGNVLRISRSTADQRMILSDGTEILPGDIIIDLHLWNERIPALGSFRPGLGWGSRVTRRIERSLAVLAVHVAADPSLVRCKALRAEAVFLTGRRAETLGRIAERLGFGAPVAPRRADPGHTMLALALAWACHPDAPVFRRRRALRHTFWMPLQVLRDRHLPTGYIIFPASAAVTLHSLGAGT